MKQLIWLGAAVGSTLGGLVPMIWGVSVFSFTSIFFSTIGGVVGIFGAYRLSQRYL